MVEGLLPADAIFFIDLEASLDEVLWFVWDFWRKGDLFVVNAIDKFDLVLSRPWCPSMQHFIVDQANWP